MTQPEMTGQRILDLFKISVHCLNRPVILCAKIFEDRTQISEDCAKIYEDNAEIFEDCTHISEDCAQISEDCSQIFDNLHKSLRTVKRYLRTMQRSLRTVYMYLRTVHRSFFTLYLALLLQAPCTLPPLVSPLFSLLPELWSHGGGSRPLHPTIGSCVIKHGVKHISTTGSVLVSDFH